MKNRVLLGYWILAEMKQNPHYIICYHFYSQLQRFLVAETSVTCHRIDIWFCGRNLTLKSMQGAIFLYRVEEIKSILQSY